MRFNVNKDNNTMTTSEINTTTLTATHSTGEYPIYIGQHLIEQPELLQQHIKQQVMIVTNETVAPLYLSCIENSCRQYQCNTLVLPDGEQHKDWQHLNLIFDALTEHQHHRDTTLIALGGGVIGDMTGFAAACYHRGVNFIQIPTTLLSQVDASIGGKTAVNHPAGKNLIGAFHQPQAVIIDTNTLSTLPQREFRAGLAEIIKAALIKDANFFDWLEQNIASILQLSPEPLQHAIKSACDIKRDVVARDEKEKGERALLNLGHTFAHAIEHELGFGQWLHGEAVGLGMRMAAKLSEELQQITAADVERINTLLDLCELPRVLPSHLKCDTLLTAMLQDKKILAGHIRLILLDKIGRGSITDQVSNEQIMALLQQFST